MQKKSNYEIQAENAILLWVYKSKQCMQKRYDKYRRNLRF